MPRRSANTDLNRHAGLIGKGSHSFWVDNIHRAKQGFNWSELEEVEEV